MSQPEIASEPKDRNAAPFQIETMKIVAANHAESLRSLGSESSIERILLETIGDDLRAFYGDAALELPSALLSAALRLDVMREPPVFTG